MAFSDTTWYLSSVGYTAVTAWSAGATIAAGALRRQVSPANGSERVFVAIIGGTTHATTEPTWTLTRGAITVDNASVSWQECTGASAVNGDLTNTPSWAEAKAVSITITLGQIIKRNNGVSYQICTVSGNVGSSEPSFSDTAGTSTTDSGVTWRSLGAVGNFTGGQAPHARAKNALANTWSKAGDTIYTKNDHAATQASDLFFTGQGTQGNPTRLICHNGSAYPPLTANLTTGASEATTGASQMNFLYTAGFGLYFRGFNFNMGSGANALNLIQPSSAGGFLTFEQCNLRIVATGACNLLFNAQTGVRFIDSYFKFANAGCKLLFQSSSAGFEMRGGGLEAGTTVPSLFISANGSGGVIDLEGVDLSLITSGNKLFVQANYGGTRVTFKRCKTASGVTLYDTSGGGQNPMGPFVDFILCDDGARNTESARYAYEGSDETELTIVRTGGAINPTGHARKIVTTASSKYTLPFRGAPFVIWNDVTGVAMTLTVYGIWGGGAVPTNGDLWIDVEYLGASGNPQSSFVSTKRAFLDASTGYTSDTSTWGGSTTKFKITSPSFTPQMAGPIIVHPNFALLSSTFYIDPKPELSVGSSIIRTGLCIDGNILSDRMNPAPTVRIGM